MNTPPLLSAALDDRYLIEREIGSGGMANVYLARDRKLDRDVALKVLRPELGAVLGAERFLAEIKISARLDHPHILTLIDSGNADGFLYYVLPYVRGESLRSKLDREQQLSIEESVAITKQVASALDYAHRQGLVHRDIKPENILLQEGEAMLADFGIALAVSEAGGNRLTQTGLSLGTPQYMSPEQATGDRNIDARSDVYSLAAVFYEMLAGEPPVSGGSAQSMIAKLMTEKPTRLRVLRDSVPPAMDDAVAKALSKTAADRFPSAGDFIRAIEKGATVGTASAPSSPKSRKMIYAGAAAAALVAIAATSFALKNKSANSARAVLGERTQLTSTGIVRAPGISPDGKQLAYITQKCGGSEGCRYSIVVQDVGSAVTRTILDRATAGYGVTWSPDRRNLILDGSIDGRYGSWLISALGAPPRYLTSGPATFYADGDSLLLGPAVKPDSIFWVRVAGLDGVVRDSVKLSGPGQGLVSVSAVPGTNWMLALILQTPRGLWQVVGRDGRVLDKVVNACTCGGTATHDAVWLARAGSGRGEAIVRIPIDRTTGKLSIQQDTMVAGLFSGFSVTADGKAMVMDEGTYDFNVWAVDWPTLLKANFTDAQRIAHASSSVTARMSPDGARILIRRSIPLGGEKAEVRYSTIPFGSTQETPLPGSGIPVSAVWADSVTVLRSTRAGNKTSFALVDVRSGLQTEMFQSPDSSVWNVARLRNGWVWLPRPGNALYISEGGKTRSIKRPPLFSQMLFFATDRSGENAFVAGWNAQHDSLALGKMNLQTGATEHWTTLFAEGGGISVLGDGSVLLKLEETQGNQSLFSLRAPGKPKRFWVSPRPLSDITVSDDMKRATAGAVDYRADAWLSKVVKPEK